MGKFAVHQWRNSTVASNYHNNVNILRRFTLILVFYYGQVDNTDADSTLFNFLLQSIFVHIFFLNGVQCVLRGRINTEFCIFHVEKEGQNTGK